MASDMQPTLVRLPEGERTILEALAWSRRITLSSMLREAVAAWLDVQCPDEIAAAVAARRAAQEDDRRAVENVWRKLLANGKR